MSSTSIQPLNFEGQEIRATQEDSRMWFVAKDVCEVLDIAWRGNTLDAIRPEWQGMRNFRTPGGEQSLTVILEPAVYKLAFRSRKPQAERLTDWLASEVLPSIYRTGGYQIRQSQPQSVTGALELTLTDYETRLEALEGELEALQDLPLAGEQFRTIYGLCRELNKRIGGRAYSLLNDAFGVPSYRALSRRQFEGAKRFLEQQVELFEGFTLMPFAPPPKTIEDLQRLDFAAACKEMHGWFRMGDIARAVGCGHTAVQKRVLKGTLPADWTCEREGRNVFIHIP